MTTTLPPSTTITTYMIGQHFGSGASVTVRVPSHGAVIAYRTRTFPYGAGANAYEAAETWAADHATEISRMFGGWAASPQEYARRLQYLREHCGWAEAL